MDKQLEQWESWQREYWDGWEREYVNVGNRAWWRYRKPGQEDFYACFRQEGGKIYSGHMEPLLLDQIVGYYFVTLAPPTNLGLRGLAFRDMHGAEEFIIRGRDRARHITVACELQATARAK